MFLGTYQTNFTGLGRVILPKKLRDELGRDQELILTRGLDGCIWGFSKTDWENQVKEQLQRPITESLGRDLRRYIFSGANKTRIDKQGRFVIPEELLTFAQVKDSCLVVGAGDHFEIWNPKTWAQILEKIYDTTKKI